jgi:hypothetical protein
VTTGLAIALIVLFPFVALVPLLGVARDTLRPRGARSQAEDGVEDRVLFDARFERPTVWRFFPLAFWSAAAAALALPIAAAIAAGRRLRVTERAIVHSPVLPTPGGGTIRAEDVAALAWIGHDNVGIRRKDGRIESVFFRNGVVAGDQESARNAIIAFVERATGRRVETAPAPTPADVAPWMIRHAR